MAIGLTVAALLVRWVWLSAVTIASAPANGIFGLRLGIRLGRHLPGTPWRAAHRTPRLHSGMSKEHLGAISRSENCHIWQIPYLGATEVNSARERSNPGEGWLERVLGTKPLKVVAFSLPDRMARAIRAMRRTGEARRAP